MNNLKTNQQTNNSNLKVPSDIHAERALLSGLLFGSMQFADINLDISDFYDSENRAIFQAILELNNENEGVDLITVNEKRGHINFDSLQEICDMPQGLTNFKEYEKIIKDKSLERKSLNLANHFAGGKINNLELIEQLQELNADYAQPNENIFSAADYSNEDIEKLKENDEHVFGMKIQYPSMCLIAGATSTGKTEFALEIADAFTKKENRLSLFCEYEDTKEDMFLRLNKKKIKNHNLIIMIGRPFNKIKDFVSKNADKKILIIIDYYQVFAPELQAKDEKAKENVKFYTNKIYQNFKSLKNTYKNVCICFLSNLNNQGIRDLKKENEINPLTILTSIKEDGNIAYDMNYIYALLFGDDKKKWFLSRFTLNENKGRKYMMLAKVKQERHGLAVLDMIYTFSTTSGRYEMLAEPAGKKMAEKPIKRGRPRGEYLENKQEQKDDDENY